MNSCLSHRRCKDHCSTPSTFLMPLRIFKALLEPGVGKVSILELEARLDDIREIMKRDALPVEMDNVEVDDQHLEALDELTFVRQLRLNQAWSSTHRTCKARFLPCIHATIPLDP